MDKPVDTIGHTFTQSSLYKIDIIVGEEKRDFALYFNKSESC